MILYRRSWLGLRAIAVLAGLGLACPCFPGDTLAPGDAATLTPNGPINLSGGPGSTLTVSVTLKDAPGNPVPNQRVDFSTTGGLTAAPASPSTDANGVAATVLTFPGVPGQGTLTARVSSFPAVPAINYQVQTSPGPVATITVTPLLTTFTEGVGGDVDLTATLKDAFGNVITGKTISWTPGSLPYLTLTQAGKVSVSRFMPAATYHVTATADGVSGTAQVVVNPSLAGPVVYVKSVGADDQLFAFIGPHGQEIPLTTSPGRIQGLDIDPVTGLLIFSQGTAAGSDVFTLKPDGTNRINRTNDATKFSTWPTWAPNRTEFFYSKVEAGKQNIWKKEIATGVETQFTVGPGPDVQPAVSPDGTRLAWVSFVGGNPDVFVSFTTFANPVQLTTDPGADLLPSWLDNNRIAFTSDRTGIPNIWTVNRDGTNLTNRTNSSAPYLRAIPLCTLNTVGALRDGGTFTALEKWYFDVTLGTGDKISGTFEVDLPRGVKDLSGFFTSSTASTCI